MQGPVQILTHLFKMHSLVRGCYMLLFFTEKQTLVKTSLTVSILILINLKFIMIFCCMEATFNLNECDLNIAQI